MKLQTSELPITHPNHPKNKQKRLEQDLEAVREYKNLKKNKLEMSIDDMIEMQADLVQSITAQPVRSEFLVEEITPIANKNIVDEVAKALMSSDEEDLSIKLVSKKEGNLALPTHKKDEKSADLSKSVICTHHSLKVNCKICNLTRS